MSKPQSRAVDNAATLPKPPASKIRDPQKLFDYWVKVNQEHPDRLLLYVYRTWPIIDRKRLDKDANIGILTEPTDEQGIYDRFGEGDYKLILSDGILYKQVCYTLLKGFRDSNSFPADIELEDLVMEDPQNKSWIERMKTRGTKFPGDEDFNMEEPVSGNVDAVAQLTATVKELAMSHMKNQSTPKQDLETSVGSAMLDNVAQASKMGNEIIKEAVSQASQLAIVPQTATNPMEQMKAVADMVKAIIPAPQPQQDLMPLFTIITESNKATAAAQLEAAKERAASSERLLISRRGELVEMRKPREDQSDPLKQLERLLTVQGKIAEANPSGGDSGGVPGWVQAVLPAIPVVVQMLSQAATAFSGAMYNRSVAATGKGTPVAPLPPVAPEQTPGVILPGAPTPTGLPTGSDTGGGGGMSQYVTFLQGIAEPLLMHVQDPELNGADFADWLVRSDSNGQMIYMALREQGKDQVMSLLQSHEQLWGRLQQIPVVFDEFLNEFLAYDPHGEPGEPGPGPDEDELERTANSVANNNKPLEELPVRTTKPKAPTKTKTRAKTTKGVN